MTTRWPEVALGDVAKIVMGQAPKGETYNDQGEGWPLIAGAGDFGDGVPKAKKFTTTPTRLSRPGDIVLGIRASIGEKVIADGEYCLGRGVAGLRGGDRLVDRYLWFWLSASASRLAAKGRGATFLQVNRADVAEMSIPLPPVEEQRRIAAILDVADDLRGKRRASLALLDSLTESIFLDMFGEGQEEVPRRPLGDHLSFLTSGSRGWAKYYADQGQRFIRIQNVLRDELDGRDMAFVVAPDNAESRRTRVRAGDVLMSITADLGRTCVVPPEVEGAFINQHLCLMRTEALVPRYLSAFLTTQDAVRQIRSRYEITLSVVMGG